MLPKNIGCERYPSVTVRPSAAGWARVTSATAIAPALQRDAVLAYQDVPFAALIVGAVLMEARRPRRGLPVLGL
ncbi:MAG: hypothetical protein ACLGIK_05315, partial [Gemmatimonadota bacterium]